MYTREQILKTEEAFNEASFEWNQILDRALWIAELRLQGKLKDHDLRAPEYDPVYDAVSGEFIFELFEYNHDNGRYYPTGQKIKVHDSDLAVDPSEMEDRIQKQIEEDLREKKMREDLKKAEAEAIARQAKHTEYLLLKEMFEGPGK